MSQKRLILLATISVEKKTYQLDIKDLIKESYIMARKVPIGWRGRTPKPLKLEERNLFTKKFIMNNVYLVI